MKYRVFTEIRIIGRLLFDYLMRHPALEHFIDYKKTLDRYCPGRCDWRVYLNNGSEFIFAPPYPRIDNGVHYDKYVEYDSYHNCPLDILLLVIEEVCKEEGT